MKYHIGIIGAGFAGMAAAYDLHELGYRVSVLEARQRVGGRTWSITLPNGEIAEIGGEWISAKDEHVLGMIDRLGLDKVEVGVNFLRRKIIAGIPVTSEEQMEIEEVIAHSFLSLQKSELDNLTLAEFILNLPLKESQKKYIYSRLQISYGTDIKNIALRMMDINPSPQSSIGQNALYYRIDSGNMSLAQAIADKIEDVRLGVEINIVERTKQSVIIRGTSAGRPIQMALDGIVMAVPVKILAALEFDPPLPDQTRNAIKSVSMGTAAKITAATRSRPSLRAYHDVKKPYWCWSGYGIDRKVRKVITAFCGSRQPQELLSTNSGDPSVWFEELVSANPDVEFKGDPVMVDWSLERYSQGCYSAFDNPATENIPHLQESSGRLFFAGEHTADNSATMDGAVDSGRRAAKQVHENFR